MVVLIERKKSFDNASIHILLEKPIFHMLIFFCRFSEIILLSKNLLWSTKPKQHKELQQHFRSQWDWQLTVNVNTMLLFVSLEIGFAVFSLIQMSLEIWCRDFPIHQLSISPVNLLSCSKAVVRAVGALIASSTAKFPSRANVDPLFYLLHLTLGMKEIGVSGGFMRWRDLALWNISKAMPHLSWHTGMKKISRF